ncbi:MAG: gluconolaconase, partial [Gemmatimonadota bacterium]|nr:gluconolaconase [Gemmatimonadota bacterium]
MDRALLPLRSLLLACTLFLLTSGGADVAHGQGLSGTLVVVNKGPSTVSIVDLASGALLGRLPTGAGPHEVVLTSDGATAVVTDYGARTGGSTLTVVDVENQRILRTIDLGPHRRPHG